MPHIFGFYHFPGKTDLEQLRSGAIRRSVNTGKPCSVHFHALRGECTEKCEIYTEGTLT